MGTEVPLPPGHVLQRPRVAELDEMLALVHACDIAAVGFADFSAGDVREWSRRRSPGPTPTAGPCVTATAGWSPGRTWRARTASGARTARPPSTPRPTRGCTVRSWTCWWRGAASGPRKPAGRTTSSCSGARTSRHSSQRSLPPARTGLVPSLRCAAISTAPRAGCRSRTGCASVASTRRTRRRCVRSTPSTSTRSPGTTASTRARTRPGGRTSPRQPAQRTSSGW